VTTPPDAFFFPAADDVVPPPLDAERFVLVVGAGEARKNVRLALEACARGLHGAAETLVIVGELGPQERALARRLRVRCGEIAASDATLRALYRKASVVLVPSRAEGYGLVAVEALACGAAVIAADATALPEATRGAALLLDPDDVAAWAALIRSLLDNPGLLAEQRARAVERFAGCDRTSHHRRMRELLGETAGERT
jgi:glycosyltransferase involved in cell wall biosynthesis